MKHKTFDFQRLCFKRFCERVPTQYAEIYKPWQYVAAGLNGSPPSKAADIALYALDDPRYFGLHDLVVGPVASGGRPALKGLWVNGQQVVENDVLRGWM